MQRTVQYIAGAGIGYRVVQTITGSGTHNLPRPTAPQFGIFSQQSNDLPPESLYFDDTPNPGLVGAKGKTPFSPEDDQPADKDQGGGAGGGGGGDQGFVAPGNSRGSKTPKYDQNDIKVNDRKPIYRGPPPNGFRGPTVRPFDGPDPNSIIPEFVRPRTVTPTPPSPPQSHRQQPHYPNYDLRPTAPAPPQPAYPPPRQPAHPYPDYFGVNSVDFDKANIRAHVQNIDLLPITPRYPSPGDALKWDIISGN